MKRTVCARIGLTISLFFLLVVFALPAEAQSIRTTDTARLQQIVRLLEEVARLQALLNEQQATRSASSAYQSFFFDVDNETVYAVQGRRLSPLAGTSRVRPVDQQLFDIFVGVVGESSVREHVRQWRVFNNEVLDIGAFVEVSVPANEWIVGVNRYGFRPEEQRSVDSFVDLFVHEFAHIKLYESPQMVERFTQLFWNENDYRHSERVLGLSSDRRFPLMKDYYQTHRERFVSDYATMNIDEDMAESFTTFVLNARPTGASVRDQKINFFYSYPEFVTLRQELRRNLERLSF